MSKNKDELTMSEDEANETPQKPLYSTAKKNPSTTYMDKVRDGMMEAAKRWNLKLDETMDFTKFDFQGKRSTRCGNRPIEANTRMNNESAYHQFWRYCIMRGNYDSILILLSPVPQNVPAMKLQTVEEFLRFKRAPVNSPFPETGSTSGNIQVKDVFGNLMFTEGGWKAPKMEMIYSAAITDIHCAHNHTAEYTDVCDDCRAKPANEQYQGCFCACRMPKAST
jgi:hypothetical protein